MEQLIVGTSTDQARLMSSSQAHADRLLVDILRQVGNNVSRVIAIAVGNEPNEAASAVSPPTMLRAIRNLQVAIRNSQVAAHVMVTTPLTGGVVQDSYPPEAARLDAPWVEVLRAVDFVMVNWFPYFAARGNLALLPAALGEDPSLPWRYPPDVDRRAVWNAAHANASFGVQQAASMLDMMLHATKFALAKAGIEPGAGRVVVGETGWPTSGWDRLATTNNSRTYYENLLSGRMLSRCHDDVAVVLFELMDEALKPGPADERFWGQLDGSLSPKWELGLSYRRVRHTAQHQSVPQHLDGANPN